MQRTPWRSSSLAWALAYGVIASAAVATCSFMQGTLIHEKLIKIGAKTLVQHPYSSNISSILDFAFLNPIAIYFLIRVRKGIDIAHAHFKGGRQISLFDRAGLVVVSAAVGIATMWFYFRGFVGSTFFTEAFEPTQSGTASISWTGWIIFSATSLFITLVALTAAEFAVYVLFVRRLNSSDLRFSLPPSVSIDVEIAVTPCLNVAYVLATLFAVLAIFVLRDFLQFSIRQSWRVWLLVPYLVACLVVFLPFWHLHRIMAEQRNKIISANNRLIENEIAAAGTDHAIPGLHIDPKKLIATVDKIEKMQSFYSLIPVWPARANDLIVPNMSVAISLATLAYKVFDAIKASIP